MGLGKSIVDDKVDSESLLQRYYDSVVLRSINERWTKGLSKALDKFSLEQYLSYINNGDNYGLEEFHDANEMSKIPVGLEVL